MGSFQDIWTLTENEVGMEGLLVTVPVSSVVPAGEMPSREACGQPCSKVQGQANPWLPRDFWVPAEEPAAA